MIETARRRDGVAGSGSARPATSSRAAGGRIRVLQIVTWLGVGGAERLVLMAAAGLPSTRYELAVCCFTERGAFADQVEQQGIPVWCLNGFPSLRHPIRLFRLYRLIRTFAPDIVHTHLQAPNLYGRAMAIVAGVPVVIASEHNVYRGKAGRHVFVERLLARHTSALVAVTEEVRRFLSGQLGLEASAIALVENGIAPTESSPERAAALRTRLGIPPGRLVIGTVASLTTKKGHVHLLEAFSAIVGRGADCALVLAGDGPERTALEALAVRLGIADRVHFLGVERHVADVLALLDVFVLPSLVEGLPLALLEAMAAGKAVVATGVGGVPDAVTSGTNGVLVEPGAAAPLADAIEMLLARPDLRAQYGERARATVLARFTEERHLASLSQLYEGLVARARRFAEQRS